MFKKLLFIAFPLVIISCNSGNKGPVMATDTASSNLQQHTANISNERKDVNIESDENSISIAEILSNREKYNGKIVTVKGEVTKYNPAILKKNWVHIQDGTEYSGEYDLTITTLDSARLGELVVFRGKIVLDRDLGYGYKYSTLMEEAIIIR